jgi:plastocyanin
MRGHRFAWPAAALLLAACLSLIACAGGAKAPPAAQARHIKVVITAFKYVPDIVTANVGDTIEFTNEDLYPHTATAKAVGDLPAFDSGAMASQVSWSFVTKAKGTYSYICTYHPNMKGTLIVR